MVVVVVVLQSSAQRSLSSPLGFAPTITQVPVAADRSCAPIKQCTAAAPGCAMVNSVVIPTTSRLSTLHLCRGLKRKAKAPLKVKAAVAVVSRVQRARRARGTEQPPSPRTLLRVRGRFQSESYPSLCLILLVVTSVLGHHGLSARLRELLRVQPLQRSSPRSLPTVGS